MRYGKMIYVKVPESPDPALKGKAMLRRQGPRRVVQTETREQIAAGIAGARSPKHGNSIEVTRLDYFTEQAEEVEYSPWIERMIRRGSLEQVDAPMIQDPPMKKAPKRKPTPDSRVTMTDKE